MSNVTNATRFVVLLFIALLLCHCAAARRETAHARTGSETKPADIASEIKRFRPVAAGDPDPTVRARAHLRLATLYSSYRNPNPDYRQALNELEIYLAGSPPEKESYGMKNWHSLLSELVREKDEIVNVKQSAAECAKENKELAKENKQLKGAIEDLKNLDLKMEEEKKKIRR